MKYFYAIIISLAFILSACNINVPIGDATPTAELLQSPSPEVTATPSPSPSATRTPTPATIIGIPEQPVRVVTQAPITQAAPTLEPSPTETPGPYTYVIQESDTLGYIMQLPPWSYPPFDPAVINAILTLNGLNSADFLPPVGSELLIPRRTPTPIPEGIELTIESDTQLGVERFGNVVLQSGEVPGCHIVAEGETLVGIMDIYNTTLEVISQLNPTLGWSGCRFNEYSGGENCRPIIRQGECVVVPQRAPTSTPTTTPSGSETPTPTPTFPAPSLSFPFSNAIVSAAPIELQWVSVGELNPDEVYLVELRDITANTEVWRQVSQSGETSLRLPESLIPTSGQPHIIEWRVVVARGNAQSGYEYVGGVGNWGIFQWQSR